MAVCVGGRGCCADRPAHSLDIFHPRFCFVAFRFCVCRCSLRLCLLLSYCLSTNLFPLSSSCAVYYLLSFLVVCRLSLADSYLTPPSSAHPLLPFPLRLRSPSFTLFHPPLSLHCFRFCSQLSSFCFFFSVRLPLPLSLSLAVVVVLMFLFLGFALFSADAFYSLRALSLLPPSCSLSLTV